MAVAPAPEPSKVRCPNCQSRLDVFETPSGGRTVSVTFLGAAVEENAAAVELFFPPDHPIDIRCPACNRLFDASGLSRIPPLPPRKTPN
jgi:DNA-directed RNA polymerase subunit RPC12/RpoP